MYIRRLQWFYPTFCPPCLNPNAFYGYKNLKDVSFPNSVKTIGEYAFYGTGLTVVRLGTGLENIETGAFLGCTELGTVYNSSDLELEKNSTTHGYFAYYARSLVTKFMLYWIILYFALLMGNTF